MAKPFKWLFIAIYDTEVHYVGIDFEPIKESIVFHA